MNKQTLIITFILIQSIFTGQSKEQKKVQEEVKNDVSRYFSQKVIENLNEDHLLIFGETLTGERLVEKLLNHFQINLDLLSQQNPFKNMIAMEKENLKLNEEQLDVFEQRRYELIDKLLVDWNTINVEQLYDQIFQILRNEVIARGTWVYKNKQSVVMSIRNDVLNHIVNFYSPEENQDNESVQKRNDIINACRDIDLKVQDKIKQVKDAFFYYVNLRVNDFTEFNQHFASSFKSIISEKKHANEQFINNFYEVLEFYFRALDSEQTSEEIDYQKLNNQNQKLEMAKLLLRNTKSQKPFDAKLLAHRSVLLNKIHSFDKSFPVEKLMSRVIDGYHRQSFTTSKLLILLKDEYLSQWSVEKWAQWRKNEEQYTTQLMVLVDFITNLDQYQLNDEEKEKLFTALPYFQDIGTLDIGLINTRQISSYSFQISCREDDKSSTETKIYIQKLLYELTQKYRKESITKKYKSKIHLLQDFDSYINQQELSIKDYLIIKTLLGFNYGSTIEELKNLNNVDKDDQKQVWQQTEDEKFNLNSFVIDFKDYDLDLNFEEYKNDSYGKCQHITNLFTVENYIYNESISNQKFDLALKLPQEKDITNATNYLKKTISVINYFHSNKLSPYNFYNSLKFEKIHQKTTKFTTNGKEKVQVTGKITREEVSTQELAEQEEQKSEEEEKMPQIEEEVLVNFTEEDKKKLDEININPIVEDEDKEDFNQFSSKTKNIIHTWVGKLFQDEEDLLENPDILSILENLPRNEKDQPVFTRENEDKISINYIRVIPKDSDCYQTMSIMA